MASPGRQPRNAAAKYNRNISKQYLINQARIMQERVNLATANKPYILALLLLQLLHKGNNVFLYKLYMLGVEVAGAAKNVVFFAGIGERRTEGKYNLISAVAHKRGVYTFQKIAVAKVFAF